MNICTMRFGQEWFLIRKLSISKILLSSIIDKIDYDKYNIFKYTNSIKQVTVEDFKNFKHAGYIFLSKNIYDLEYINIWLSWLKDNNLNIKFLSKPFPPIEIFNKIKIM